MMDTGTLNFLWSQSMVAGFVAAGVTHAVFSPGSRSTPLALAMLRQPELTCEAVIDERSAAFFALGIAKASRRPVLLLATSGTAPANWLPAVIEAGMAGIPLILISADRPPELQGVGANQTIDQIRLFGTHVRASHNPGTPEAGFDPEYLHRLAARVFEQSTWPHPGPVHINQPFREPLLPGADLPQPALLKKVFIKPPALLPDPDSLSELADAIAGRPGIIVCGEIPATDGLPAGLADLAAHLQCPIFAEPLSNLRYGPHDRSHIAVRYNVWLADRAFAAAHQPEWVLRLGAWPVTRHLQNYVAGKQATQALIEPWPRWTDPSHQLSHVLRADPLAACQALLAAKPIPGPAGWLANFIEQENSVSPNGGNAHIGELLAALPDGMPIFIGNSLAIRQLDSASGTGDKQLTFFGNRGASGIDGNISTALGIAAVHGHVVALIGDLTCQHDLGGLALAGGKNAIIVVINNGGGGIFDLLPQANLPEFEAGWRTPQKISFEHAAATFGLAYHHVGNGKSLKDAVEQALASRGPQLIEVST